MTLFQVQDQMSWEDDNESHHVKIWKDLTVKRLENHKR